MTNQHPITPPPELVDQWTDMLSHCSDHDVFAFAARWGADMELEACCAWHTNRGYSKFISLREDRRPKPPSLKEQALEVVTGLEKRWDLQCDLACIRRALEALPND